MKTLRYIAVAVVCLALGFALGIRFHKERVIATLNRQPVDRAPIDCWLYQKQFVEKLAAEYGPREQFLDEFNIDIFATTWAIAWRTS